MINKEQKVECIAEEMLRAYSVELCESENLYLEALEDDMMEDPPFFVEPSEKKIPRKRTAKQKRTVKRTLALVAILVLIQGMIVISEGSKENTFNYFQEEENGHRILTYLGLGRGEELPAFALSYVPDGYSVIDETVNELAREITYLNEDGKYLYFTVQQSEDHNMSIDNESLKRENISIRGYQGYLFHGGGRSILMWQIGEYTLDISGQLSREEMIQLAEGVVLKK